MLGKTLKKLKGKYFPYLLVLPEVVYLLLIIIYPLIFSLNLTFYKWTFGLPFDTKKFVWIQNYLELFSDSLFWTSVAVLLKYAVVAITLELSIGFGVALLLNRKLRGAGVMKVLMIVPLTITPTVVGLVWRLLYNAQYGMINYFLSLFNIGAVDWLGSYTLAFFSVIIADVWQWTPFMILILLSGLQALPEEPYDAAIVDGASSWQVLKYLTIPMLVPVILIAVLIRIMDILRLFDKIFVLTFGGPGTATEVLSLYTYRIGFVQSHMGKAAAASYILLFIIVGISFIFVKLSYKQIEM